jgi:predicted membrane protein
MQESKRQYRMERMAEHRNNGTALSRLFTALIFLAAGGLLIADQTGYISSEWFHRLFNWQMLVIGIGLVSISKRGNSLGGMIAILIGLVFLAPVYFDIPFNTRQLFWPAILMGIGVLILFNGFGACKDKMRFRFKKEGISDTDKIDGNHIFGGGDHYITSDNFKGGSINAIFGGGKYDLSRCKLAEGTHVLDVSFIFGGVELILPAEWPVKVEVDSILGGFSNKGGYRQPDTEAKGVLVVRGTAIFGGGEIKRI